MKQNLRIKIFLGTGEKAVMTQIWVALMHFLPVDYIKFMNKVRSGLTEITIRLKERLMGNSHLLELLSSGRKQPAWDNLRQLEIFGEFSV